MPISFRIVCDIFVIVVSVCDSDGGQVGLMHTALSVIVIVVLE